MKLSFSSVIKSVVLLFMVVAFFSSCYYDNIDELKPGIAFQPCDTTGTITYLADVKPILDGNCGTNNSCHNSTTAYPMDTYNGVYAQATGGHGTCYGTLMLALRHDPCVGTINYMPSGGGFLNSCSINKIDAWVNRGCPE